MRKRFNDIIIDHSDSQTDFLSHLSSPLNSRILFSAPFGSGKSTFIKEFFESYSNYYVPVQLYPVIYASSANHDVFELIKFDILSEIVLKYNDQLTSTQPEEFSLALKTHAFFRDGKKIGDALKSLISATGEIGKSAVQILEAFQKLKVDFKEFSDELERGDELTIQAYLNKHLQTAGSPREMDEVSNLISKCLLDLQGPERKKQTVLVIDDLDRLDPEHIFRVLNVFSAHFDPIEETNKFGFDKVVCIADLSNIKHIYHHRYGAKVDFQGYMNKFYSSEPFAFNARKNLSEKIEEFVNEKFFKPNENRLNRINRSEFDTLLKYVINTLVHHHKLTIRMMDHSKSYNMIAEAVIRPKNFGRKMPAIALDFYVLIDMLKIFYHDLHTILTLFADLAQQYSEDHGPHDEIVYSTREHLDRYVASICLPFLSPDETVFGRTDGTALSTGIYNYGSCVFIYELIGNINQAKRPEVTKICKSAKENSEEVGLAIFKLLFKTLEEAISRKMIEI